jgi:transmembrane sensor
MMTEQDWERLARYVSGEASSAERAEVERWVAASTEHKAMLDSLERRWAAAAAPREAPIDRAWARLSSKLSSALIGHDDEDVIPLAPRRARWSMATGLVPLAAVILVAVGVTALWRSRVRHDGTASLGTPVAASLETRTGVGERRTLDLPDGSKIALGATTVLRVGERFAQGERHVYLQGQALFTVRHDSLRPFVVHAAGTVTEDLGTEFDVRAYPGDSIVRVVVAQGAVAVRREGAADTALTLRPGDVARLGAAGSATLLREQNVERLLAWSSGEIVFDNTPLSEVAEELERWFDIECRIADTAIQSRPLSVRLRSDMPLDELLRVVGMSTEVRAERDGRVVTFSRGTPHGASYRATPRPRRVEAGG